MSENERVMEVWTRERERLARCEMDEVTASGQTEIRVFHMHEPDKPLWRSARAILVFYDRGIVIAGDRGTLVTREFGGVRLAEFASAMGWSWDYLAGRFMPREYHPLAMADALDALAEENGALADEREDDATAAGYRADADKMRALARDLRGADEDDLAEGGKLSRAAVYGRLPAFGFSEPWDIGRGYDPERAGYLAAVHERFRALYQDPWMRPENPPSRPLSPGGVKPGDRVIVDARVVGLVVPDGVIRPGEHVLVPADASAKAEQAAVVRCWSDDPCGRVGCPECQA